MMRRKKIIPILLLGLLLAVPAFAVFKEKNISRTLEVLSYELRNTWVRLSDVSEYTARYQQEQHESLLKLIENCNELSLMLYSQKQDFTFDLTYALDAVTDQYLKFTKDRLPYDKVTESLEIETDRYEKLLLTLQSLTPGKVSEGELEAVATFTDSLGRDSILALPSFVEFSDNPYEIDSAAIALRDSCIYYTSKILDIYWDCLFLIDEDNTYYQETNDHIKLAYNYAQERYKMVQKKIFTEGQTPYLSVLRNFGRNVREAWNDCVDKYSTSENNEHVTSDWRGAMVLGFTFLVIFYILVAALLSNLLVRLLIKRVKYFQTEYFKEHKLLFILLAGIVIFAITIMVISSAAQQNFIRMASVLISEYAWMLAAIFLSMLIRLNGGQTRKTLTAYLPLILMGLIIITFRISFIPNSLINLIFPPLLLIIAAWQYVQNRAKGGEVHKNDKIYMWISFGVLAVATAVSWSGYVMMALLLAIWWLFQFTVIMTIDAVYFLLSRFHDKTLTGRMTTYKEVHPGLPLPRKESYIEVTWLYDFLTMALVPILAAWSIPVCIFMSGDVFDLSGICLEYFTMPFLSVENVIHLSMLKVVVVVSLFFLFRYISYAFKAFYRIWKTKSFMAKNASSFFRETDINFNLADNVISLLCWGVFAVISFVLLKIPATALTIVTTGLAAGVGFALKDVLNNFFYGVQLMSGRLRVGDVVECDGIRGTVENMSYQTTQIAAADGSLIAFSNSALFSKNFKNLTRNNSYELLILSVGVKYGTDIETARKVITEALKPLLKKDRYGNDLVEPAYGIKVELGDFGDSSVDLSIKQKVNVESRYSYAAEARERIYNALNENNIEIPFPQRDVYIKKSGE